MRPPNVSNYLAIDLFAGAGGLSRGLTAAGFRVAAAVDNDRAAVATYRNNLGDHIVEAPIEEVSVADLRRRAGIGIGECTLLAGGPPCQGFSTQRRGDRDDPRNALFLQFVRFVRELRPRYFLIENVGGLLFRHGKPYLKEVIANTGRLGYACHLEAIDAVEFGVPQYRTRAFLVGEHVNGSSEPKFRFPRPRAEAFYRTVRDAIGDLPSPPDDGSHHPDIANHYREARLSPLNIERIRHVPQGGGREHIPAHLQLPCHRDNPSHRHLDVYGRLAWEEPSGTLTARFDSFTRGRFGHPVEHRSITLREGARLQTFPDNFVFEGNREEGARQIGNAVPPLMARNLGGAVIRAIEAGSSHAEDLESQEATDSQMALL